MFTNGVHVSSVPKTLHVIIVEREKSGPIIGPHPHHARRDHQASQPRQTISLQDAALSGTAFTEDEVNWKVLAPLWSAAEKRVDVWYYEVDAASEWCTADNETPWCASA